MTIKKTKIPKHLSEDIKGFEDIFSDYLEDNHKSSSTNEMINAKIAEQHELHHFLELEIKRLTFLDNFLSKKISILKNFSQTKKLIEEQKKKRTFVKDSLLQALNSPEHRLHQNLKALMKSHFDH